MIQKKYLFTAHVLVYSIIFQYPAANALSKICQNMSVFWPVFSRKRTESKIVRENAGRTKPEFWRILRNDFLPNNIEYTA